uniref:2OG-Fe(II) oxygenase family protein n=1 Tax=Cordyceps militaris TaxID=73501 RepID=J3S8A1_CORMI|nr:2OG-Fe(II) oxygenase family protein [Cordyceps militaris]
MPDLTQNDVDLCNKAALRTIRCAELQHGNPLSLRDLLISAQEDGIFYLDFGTGKWNLDQSVKDVDRLNHALFDMPIEEKLLFDIDCRGKLKLNGYVLAYLEAALTSKCLDMTQLILSALSRAFDLPAQHSFESRHDSVTSPLDSVRLLRYPRAIGGDDDGVFRIPQLAHADMGSLTFLFTSSPGLQILPAGATHRQHVLPLPGCAIVHFGDALKMLSGGRIESVLHRVVTTPGSQVLDRYSFAFLVRPEPSAG